MHGCEGRVLLQNSGFFNQGVYPQKLFPKETIP